MKKILLATAMFMGIAYVSNAQGLLDKAKATTSQVPTSFDVNSIASQVMGSLTPALALSAVQKPKVTDLVTGFLTKKKDILPLQATDKASYTSKFSALSGDFMGKIKTVLTVAQYTKFLGLKPKAPSASNVLSNLFF